MKMPFGKHKGEDLEDLDSGYLRWLCENITGNTALINEAEAQLEMREGKGVERNGT